MKAVIGFLLMSLQVAHAVKTSCDGRQNGTQCFGVLGGAVDIQLMDNVSEIPRFTWKMNNSLILIWRNNSIALKKDNRIPFFPSNGSVRINDLRRNDSDEYKLEMFGGDGKSTGWKTLQLFVEAAVSSVQLVTECLSQGQMKVSCVSQGDSPQYSWALDGHNLTDSELFSRDNETNIIVLRQNISGHLVCSVRNLVSNSSKWMNLNDCGFIFINCTSNGTQIAKWVYKENNTLCVEPTTVPPTTKYTIVAQLPVMGGVLAALVIVLIASIVFVCVHKDKKITKVEKENDDQEMTYADVRIVKKQGRRVDKSEEADVEYGQVKFSKKPRTSQTNPTMDDTVYAQVRRAR
ncbi:T-cell surface antigen CD2-like isoform X3 [Xiphophorus maculatus]|uniref:T-cell surface antigen CD2-like isoform X3 n=1 Tax=Xiphophorus maculatus TaxID=8083 RepID=UPI000C6F011A|nr:T-cell surface antigen CD2-like isoform X3 [Xiphophorus maculatus]